jgi:isopenicillin-N epimerase
MELTGLPTIYPQTEGFYTQMAVAPLPYQGDPAALQKRLHDHYNIEIPCFNWQNWSFLRLSIQGYNTPADIDTLLTALAQSL